jgi:hypothetical protein
MNEIKTYSGKCIEWDGFKNKEGYGLLYHNGIQWRAHRLAYKNYYGDFDRKLLVCHKCDNPSCVNPKHLFLGTQKDNMQDKINKKRGNFLYGEKNPHHKLSDRAIKLIRMFISQGVPQNFIANAYGISKAHVSRIKHNKQRVSA